MCGGSGHIYRDQKEKADKVKNIPVPASFRHRHRGGCGFMKIILDNPSKSGNERYVEYISSGLFKSAPGWRHPRRVIDDYAMLFIMDGEVYIREEDREFKLVSGDVLVLAPGMLHEGTQPSPGDVSYYWVHFRSDFFSASDAGQRYIHISDGFQIQSLFKQLLHVVNSENYPRYMAALYLAQIIGETEHTRIKSSRVSNALASEVREYIKVNSVDEMLTLSKIAAHFGFSPDYVGRLFRSEFGLSVKDCIINEKINAAKHYLLFTYLSVKEIAAKLGFTDTDKFIKYFKYHENISPVKYRNTYTNTHINKK